MPDVRISPETKSEIEKQPERSRLALSFAKTTSILIAEALDARRAKLKRAPKLKAQ